MSFFFFKDYHFRLLKKIFFYLFIFGCVGYLLLHAGFSLVAASTGYLLLVAVQGLLVAVASLVVEHGL